MGPVPSLAAAGIRRTEERESADGISDEKVVAKGGFVAKNRRRREKVKFCDFDWAPRVFIELSLRANYQNALGVPDLVSKRAASLRTRFDDPDAIAQLVSPNSRPKIMCTKMPF